MLNNELLKVFVVLDIEPLVLFSFNLIKLGDDEVDANPAVLESLQDDWVLPEVILSTSLNEHITVSGGHVQHAVRSFPKLEDYWKVIHIESREKQAL